MNNFELREDGATADSRNTSKFQRSRINRPLGTHESRGVPHDCALLLGPDEFPLRSSVHSFSPARAVCYCDRLIKIINFRLLTWLIHLLCLKPMADSKKERGPNVAKILSRLCFCCPASGPTQRKPYSISTSPSSLSQRIPAPQNIISSASCYICPKIDRVRPFSSFGTVWGRGWRATPGRRSLTGRLSRGTAGFTWRIFAWSSLLSSLPTWSARPPR